MQRPVDPVCAHCGFPIHNQEYFTLEDEGRTKMHLACWRQYFYQKFNDVFKEGL